MSAVRVAVVGLGYWGPNLVRNLNELASAEVVAVCDRDLERLELIRRRYPAVQAHTNIDDVLADETIDAVALATPVSTHFPLGRAARPLRGAPAPQAGALTNTRYKAASFALHGGA